MPNSMESSSLRDRLGKLLEQNASVSWLSMLIILAIAGFVLWAGNTQNNTPLALSGIAIAWVGLRWLMWLQKLRWGDFGFHRPKSWIRTIVFSIGGTVFLHIMISLILAPLVISLTKQPVNTSQFDPLRGNFLALLIGLIIVWTLAAFGEELVFRGYIMHTLARPFKQKYLGWVFAVMMTSILFGLGHSYQGMTGIILTGVVGIFYALAFFASRKNLWVPILIHGLYDTSAFLIIFFNLDRALG